MKFAEAVLTSAETEFRAQFEGELRKRLLDIATAEIEHIVYEITSKVITHTRLDFNVCSQLHNLNMNIKVLP